MQDAGVTNPKGQLVSSKDPLGNESTIAYDSYRLLPVQATDPAGLVTNATHDYRVFQPSEVTDPNDNVTRVAFDALGFVESIAAGARRRTPRALAGQSSE